MDHRRWSERCPKLVEPALKVYFFQIHLCDLNPSPESKKKKKAAPEDDQNEEVKTLLFHFGMSGCFQFTPGNALGFNFIKAVMPVFYFGLTIGLLHLHITVGI